MKNSEQYVCKMARRVSVYVCLYVCMYVYMCVCMYEPFSILLSYVIA